MTFTLRESSAAVAAPTRASVPAADPWDAPYFGGRVYFSYHPTLYTTPHIPPAPALPSADIASSAAAASTAPAPAEPVQVRALSQRLAPLGLDPWDAPYFGGPVYFHYPAFPVAAAAQLDETPAAPAGGLLAPSALSASPVAVETAGPPAATPALAGTLAPPPRRRGWLARLFRAG
jgi:hypothetical protein